MKYRPPTGSTSRALALRRNPTVAEKAMWKLLRSGFPEAHFRQQVTIRSYFADFASHRCKIVIEVDGGQHADGADLQRDELIVAEGYRILRFWNTDVLGNSDGVYEIIRTALDQRHPHPNPPPSRGREEGER